MKKLTTLFWLLLSMAYALSADVVTIGTGTSSSGNYYPFSSYYNYNRSAALYTAAEIGVTGTITDLSWNIATANSTVNIPVKIYLKSISASTLTDDTWSNLINGATLVYDASGTMSPVGWKTFDITDFSYTGDNLVVLCESGSAPFTSPYPVFQFTTAPDNSTYMRAQTDATAPSAISGNNMKSNIRMSISTASYANDLAVTALSTSPVSVWTGESTEISTTVKNNGTADLSNKDVVIKIDGSIVSTQTIASLTAGSTTNLNYSWTATAGTHTIRVEVPAGDENSANDFKEITINVNSPVSVFPFAESFDNASFPPAAWTNLQLTGTTLWSQAASSTYPTAIPHTGAGFAKYAYNSGSAALITPRLSLSSDSYKVKFWMYRDTGYGSEKLDIYLNTTPDLSGSPTLLGTVNRQTTSAPIVATTGWYEYSFDFSGTKSSKYVIFKATSTYGSNMYIDDAAVVENVPMTYSSSTANQSNTNAVMTNTVDQQVIGIQIETAGALSPVLDLKKLIVNANGTTNVSDISNAKIYYTGTSSTFATTNQFGTTIATPTLADFEISGSQTLAEGTNYFWLTYDISATASVNNVIDGECTSVTVAGAAYVPTTTAPAGSRAIKAALTGTLTINPDGTGATNYTTFASAIADLNLLGVGTGGVTFVVAKDKVFTETPLTITTTGSASNPIVFQASATGTEKPIINFTGTSSTVDAGFKLAGSDYVTFDGLNISDAGSASTNYLEHGFYLDATGNAGCKNNTIKNCTVDLARYNTNSKGIRTYSNPTSTDGSNDNNKFYNNTINDAFNGYYFECAITTNIDNGNEVGVVSSGVSTLSNIGGAGGVVYGIYYKNQGSIKVFSNDISGGTLIDNKFYGIYNEGSATTAKIYSNSIHDWTSSINSNYSYLAGIYIADGTNQIFGNKVYLLNATSSDTYSRLAGIYLAGGTLNSVYNNFISQISAPAYTTGNSSVGVAGLYHSYGAANIYHNTVKLNFTSTSSANVSAALCAGSGSSLDIINNLFVNSVSGTYAKAIAFKYGSTSYTSIKTTTNNNLYYAGAASSKNLIFENSVSTGYQTLSAYQAVITGRETNSQSSVITFEPSTTGELKYQRITANAAVFNTGTPITGITTDFYGTTRPQYAQVDIGAYELVASSGLAESVIPAATALSQNYPNPFNPETTINFALAKDAQVNLSVFNAKGEVVKTLVNSSIQAGYHSVNFSAVGLNSGLYFYKLTTPENSFMKKMILVK